MYRLWADDKGGKRYYADYDFFKMKISIITATFNSAANIAQCLQSVNSQTYTNIEHIIVDGASTDETVAIIQSTPNRVTSVISEPDKGIYDALNKGIQKATGDLIGFLHSDDRLASPGTLQMIAETFERTGADGIYGNLVFVNNDDKVVRTWISEPFDKNEVRFGWMPPHPTLFLKTEVYGKKGLFDIRFSIAGDYEFMLRVMQDPGFRLEYIPEVITRMGVGGVSTGNWRQLIRKSKEDMHALRKNGFQFPVLVIMAKIGRKIPQLFKR